MPSIIICLLFVSLFSLAPCLFPALSRLVMYGSIVSTHLIIFRKSNLQFSVRQCTFTSLVVHACSTRISAVRQQQVLLNTQLALFFFFKKHCFSQTG